MGSRTKTTLRRRRGPDIAFIFGSGASTPPLLSQQDLVERLFTAPDETRILAAKKYLRRTFGGLTSSQAPKGILRFEDIVGPLEIAESEEYWFHFGGKEQKENRIITNSKVLDALDTWVAMSLDPPELPRPEPSPIRGSRSGGKFEEFYGPRLDSPLCYSRLVALLQSIGALEKSVFISMNYDILFDRTLNASRKYAPDYDLEDIVRPSLPGSGLPERTKVKLLKLHGSLNWRICDSCHLLRDTENTVVWPNSQCNDCGSKTARPMLIRPTLLKDFRHRVWKDVWRKAGHDLASASHWYFVGYSLPLADVWMLRLLAQSARSGGIDVRDRHICVINLDENVTKRFKLLFPNAVGRLETFQSWIDESIKDGSLLGSDK